MAVTLTTERLVLRPWRDEDVEAFATINADPRIGEHLGGAHSRARSEELAGRVHRHFDQHGFGFWVVELADTDDVAGFVGLQHVTFEAPFSPTVEVGWRLAHRYWGRGYAIEAARASLDYGFGELAFPEIVAFTVPANLRSQRVMERLGMTRDPADDFDHPARPVGDPWRRHVLYRITQSAWISRA